MPIYKIINRINNKVYIGKTTKKLTERFNVHVKNCRKKINTYLYDAMNHYGIDNFEIKEIDSVNLVGTPADIERALNKKEKYWIKKYQSFIRENGYNMTLGGDGGNTWVLNKHKELTSKRLSESIKNSEKHKASLNTKEHKNFLSIIHKGKILSEKHKKQISKHMKKRFKNPKERRKMSLAHKGKILTKDHKDKIGKFQKGRKKNLDHRNKIGKANKGKRKGKTWEEIFGKEKAKQIRIKRKKNLEICGVKKCMD